MSRAYSADLAHIHDIAFSDYARAAAPQILKLLKGHLKKNGHSVKTKRLVVDLGCGSGVLASELIRAGYDVLGVDISDAMIRLARRKAPAARFIKASFLDVQLPSCDGILALGEVVNYLFDSQVDRKQLSRFFARVLSALRPGGVFFLDVAGPGRAGAKGVREGYSTGRNWAILFRVEEDRRSRRLTRTITTFRRIGKDYRRTREVHEQRLYTPSDIALRLTRAGFKVRQLAGYGQSKFPAGLTGFVATKL